MIYVLHSNIHYLIYIPICIREIWKSNSRLIKDWTLKNNSRLIKDWTLKTDMGLPWWLSV